MFSSMTVIVAAAVVLIACIAALFVFSGRSDKSTPAADEYPGTLADIVAHIKDVMDEDLPCDTLVADIPGTEDFFQFGFGDKDGVQLSHPLITERQKQLRSRLLEVIKQLELEPTYDDSVPSVDCNISGKPEDVAAKCKAFAIGVFSITEDTPISYKKFR